MTTVVGKSLAGVQLGNPGYNEIMRILITAGSTREAIDPVRYIGNRSSGKMGAAIAAAALNTGHSVTVILGPVSVVYRKEAHRVDVETAQQMLAAVLCEFPGHDPSRRQLNRAQIK